MTLSFTDATGNYFNRLGTLGGMVREMGSYQDSLLTQMTDVASGVVGQYEQEPDIQAIMGSGYLGVLSATGSAVGSICQQMAAATVNRMIFRDNPQLGQTLTQGNTLASLTELLRQMRAAGATVLRMDVSATGNTFAPPAAGNGVLVVSVYRPLDGLLLENAYEETLSVICSADSYNGNATAYNEPFSVTGTGSQTDFFAFNWPLGSNTSLTINAIDGDTSNGAGNILNNSGFADWTGGVPDGWSLDEGTNIAEESTLVYTGGAALRIDGDGATLTELSQLFGAATSSLGTTTSVLPQTQYSFNVFLRRGGVAISGGAAAVVELIDQDGNAIADNNGVDNSLAIDLTALSTSYTAYNVAFRTPTILPDTTRLRFRLTTAIPSGQFVLADKASMGLMTQLYTSGPYVASHSGSIPAEAGDRSTITVTNNRGAAGTLDTFQTLFARLYPTYVYGNGLLLPSSATPSISDTLI